MGTTSQNEKRKSHIARGKVLLQELKDLGFPCTHLITDEGVIKLAKWMDEKEEDAAACAPDSTSEY